MNTANLENCKKLYELSGWVGTQNYWKSFINHQADKWSEFKVVDFNGAKIPKDFGEETYPAYDLGYLLRKLPKEIEHRDVYYSLVVRWIGDNDMRIHYWSEVERKRLLSTNTEIGALGIGEYEDAACLLAIKLFEKGILHV